MSVTVHLKNNVIEISQKVEWKIQNFSIQREFEKDHVSERKSLFNPETKSLICKWHMELNSEEDHYNLSFEVDKVDKVFIVSGNAWLLNRDGVKCNKKQLTITEVTEKCYMQFGDDPVEFIPRSVIYDNFKRYIDESDTITIFCEFNFTIDYPLTSDNDNENRNKSNRNKLLESFTATLFNNPELSDVILMVGDEKFHGHKLILSAQSSYFAGMFRGNFKESDARIVKIDKADSKHFEKMLTFMYTDHIEKLEYDQLLEMLALANKYGVDDLITCCVKGLTKTLCVNNCLDLLITANETDSIFFKKTVMDFTTEHINQIMKLPEWKTLKKQHPDIIIDITSAAIVNKKIA